MSKIVAAAAIRGAKQLFNEAKSSWENAVKDKGADCEVAFPGTAFYFPMACALMGLEVKKLKDIQPIIEEAESLLHEEPSERLNLPYLGDTLDSGIAALFC
ncbi:CO dehydrogenase/CO-methylating acetyl-CoA synthase complex subunit beta, partial [bacterium]|nr:CO dehydrogenase/CO-methylating acetyl-CoA synthase complex subunit beta [bacterium]